MRDLAMTISALLFLFLVLPTLGLWMRDKIRSHIRRETAEQRAAGAEARRWRMLNPCAQEVEALHGGLLPNRLLKMYAAPGDFLLNRDFGVCAPGKDPDKDSWWIGDFVPLHRQDQELTADLQQFGKGCCFAGDGMGNFYWVPVEPERRSDAPVFFVCHDPWGNQKVADSLEEFLSWRCVASTKKWR
jgi:SMI1 / KNR4 family (SUKH-1)